MMIEKKSTESNRKKKCLKWTNQRNAIETRRQTATDKETYSNTRGDARQQKKKNTPILQIAETITATEMATTTTKIDQRKDFYNEIKSNNIWPLFIWNEHAPYLQNHANAFSPTKLQLAVCVFFFFCFFGLNGNGNRKCLALNRFKYISIYKCCVK